MAENESLDFGNPRGQRWRQVLDAVKKRKSVTDVARQIEEKLAKALRKSFTEFASYGVTLGDLLQNRNDQRMLKRLTRQCDGHEFANLFADTAAISTGKDDQTLLASYITGIIDRVSDQITHRVAGIEWPSIPELQSHFKAIRGVISPEIERIAKKLANDHSWKPIQRSRKQRDKAAATKSLLGMSLLGDAAR